MKRIAVVLLLLPLLFMATLARAVPTVEAVQVEVKAGRYEQAETMMREVVQAKPKSARAHYVLAEILAHNGRIEQAADEAAQARRLDPAIAFTDAAKFARFEQQLQERAARGSARAGVGGGVVNSPGAASLGSTPSDTRTPAVPVQRSPAPREAGGSGLPGWIWLAGAALLGVVAWRMLAARRSAAPTNVPAAGLAAGYPVASGAPGMPGAGYAPGMQPGYGSGMQPGMQQGMAPGRGPGMMGVGLGVAGGVAAGMLAERMLHGNQAQAATPNPGAAPAEGGGGMVPGMFEGAPGADPLRDRAVDFGNGGADWDSGGGSVDLGSGSGGGDDSW